MAEKRKDSKGRVLRSGEFQRKDGKYEFKYTDGEGCRHSVYSWKLVDTDKVPEGKRCDESLREKEKRILRDLDDGIDYQKASSMTLDDYFDIYITNKCQIKQNSMTLYKVMYNKHIRDGFGKRLISSIKFTDMKKLYKDLHTKSGLKFSSIKIVDAILRPTLDNAVRDGIIRYNPATKAFAEVTKTTEKDGRKRHPLSEEEQSALIKYVSTTPQFRRWLQLCVFLLGTGCRIGEALGLRWEDCDFERNIIIIRQILTCPLQEDGKRIKTISSPKTNAGTRLIPMLPDVKNALLEVKDNYPTNSKAEVDGYTGFIFLNKDGNVLTGQGVNSAFKTIRKHYNETEILTAAKEKREPVLLPHFTAHNLRHTFCTRFCKVENDIKIIQEIMGHSTIQVTMDIYNEVNAQRKIESFAALEEKLRVV